MKTNHTAASPVFVNKNDQLYINAQKIKPIKGFEDIVVHSDTDMFYLYDNDGKEYTYNPKEFADIIRNSQNYDGGNVRLIACYAGAKVDGAAQLLANELNVSVMASNTIAWTYPDGNIIIGTAIDASDGKWIIFNPKR